MALQHFYRSRSLALFQDPSPEAGRKELVTFGRISLNLRLRAALVVLGISCGSLALVATELLGFKTRFKGGLAVLAGLLT